MDKHIDSILKLNNLLIKYKNQLSNNKVDNTRKMLNQKINKLLQERVNSKLKVHVH